MKNQITNHLTELSGDELTRTEGGSFAFDAGRFLRFVALDVYHGYNNGLGFTIATLDFTINSLENSAS